MGGACRRSPPWHGPGLPAVAVGWWQRYNIVQKSFGTSKKIRKAMMLLKIRKSTNAENKKLHIKTIKLNIKISKTKLTLKTSRVP